MSDDDGPERGPIQPLSTVLEGSERGSLTNPSSVKFQSGTLEASAEAEPQDKPVHRRRRSSMGQAVLQEQGRGMLFLIAVFWVSDIIISLPLEHFAVILLVAFFLKFTQAQDIFSKLEVGIYIGVSIPFSYALFRMFPLNWLTFIADVSLLSFSSFALDSNRPSTNPLLKPTTWIAAAGVLDFVLAASVRSFPGQKFILALSAGLCLPLFLVFAYKETPDEANRIKVLKAHPKVAPIIADRNAFKHFICPITNEVMEDPVIAADGHTYERVAVEKLLRSSTAVSMVTGQKFTNTSLTPDVTMRQLILEELLEIKKSALAERLAAVAQSLTAAAVVQSEMRAQSSGDLSVAAASAPLSVPVAPSSGSGPSNSASSHSRRASFNPFHHARRRLQLGGVFLKYGRHGEPKRRFVVLNTSVGTVEWFNEDRSGSQLNAIPLQNLLGVVRGRRTDVFVRNDKKAYSNPVSALLGGLVSSVNKEKDDLSFSVIGNERTLDLECSSKMERDQWATDFELLIKNWKAEMTDE